MSEELAAGYVAPGCDKPGGLEIIYAFAVKNCLGVTNIASFTLEADGVTVQALTLISGKRAWAFEVEEETSKATAESAGEKVNQATSYTHTTTYMIHSNLSQDIVNRKALTDGRNAHIVKNNGQFELYNFANGAKAQITRDTGQAYEDMNGSTVTAVSKERQPEYIIPEAIVTALLTVAS